MRNTKDGWLLCDGSSYSVSQYQQLYAIIGNKFGGDETNFNVPNYSGKFLEMDITKELGTDIEAGLPNITGTDRSIASGNWGFSGSIFGSSNSKGTGATYSGTSTSTSYYRTTFDASLSNPIYGKSSTVQPPASIVNYFIKY